ncbi:MAG: exosome complex protein Rrp42 [Nitrososphaeraceae archaeon]|jgi:exosome complex component RRP42|nr:exosome complex protein Rrp42 [Nitrososphaeraceae archaeon]MDW0136886.1 exosome complex protein Rrp42 [Nitrososphaeraceae archaeon]MDW0138872.1 exosome complex protein Rrp42 [Nitrososphaeraceae archaeon]MDW0142922.1 exosome complex protein Rrp42 [Nitrososphaeraceae archaeon]MDW0145928.1 exosome complex protein Rrp42 [Nitrososphaeraceae archaeon]
MSLSKKSTVIVENLRKKQMRESISAGKRLDERGLDEIRPIEIELDVIKKASGSAWVKLGNTEVVTGVKVETGEPFEGLENSGALIITAEVLPIASPHVEPGPPDEETIELARVVDRGVRESEMLDLSKLVLVPGRIVYTIFVDCSIINVDGNLFDAASYAVVSALASCKLPVFEIKDDKVVETGRTQEPPITTMPVSITTVKIGDYLLSDPNTEEEACMDARLTITTNSKGSIVAMQKGLKGNFSVDEVKSIADKARIKGEEIRGKLKGLINVG